jgi:transposase
VAGPLLSGRASEHRLRAQRWLPPALAPAQQATLKAAVQASPRAAGIEAGDWTWKVVRRFCRERFGVSLCRSSCLNYLHRLGFVVRRPKKRLLKADEAKRAAFVREYAAWRVVARLTGAKIFFADEAHFYADAELRGKWVLKGAPALVDATSPRYGEKASYYSAVCLETGEVDYLALAGNSCAATSATFLQHLRARHAEPLIVIWDNSPAHGGEPLRAYLRTPALRLRLVRLPAYSPDFNADEHLWGWIREEVTANTCFGTAANVRAHVDPFFAGLAARADEVQRRCQTALQTRADALDAVATATVTLRQARDTAHVTADSTLALV